MRFRHRDGTPVHLAYCTNVHPAEDLPGVLAQLAAHAEPVRERLNTGRLGLGLWLARDAARALAADPSAVTRLGRELAVRGLETVTLNGFPYRGFHEPVVKRRVFTPDWTDPRRLAHTLDLARVLAALLPEDAARGSVSTVPLGWGAGWSPAREERALFHLALLADGLAKLAAETGRRVRVGLEPEPGAAVDTAAEAAARLAGRVDPERVGVCLDACHLAVDFERPASAVAALTRAGLPVVKAQLSAALQTDRPGDPTARAALGRFAEPRFLHQTRGPAPCARWDDLPAALTAPPDAPGPWRTHMHIPLHADPAPPLASTRPVLEETLTALLAGPAPVTDHLEAETYTWSVLPEPPEPGGLTAGIAAELAWTRARLLAHGLTEEPT
ncbi:metabolite traffic protein EboE [Streptomyces sp. DSM 44917]|uniref:Metabolite traffic protein EboE n=1 Tax=Streptomyces boetiae TaxID=3075541 RepID=A0ABU2L751_9ACTN|nr:metabolite traffic protein EboE [Streptomyces sp. DSM 44917]MDT0307394.1 metabolite traffic protein EboE [Streptomyces sp. DSM 44917]